MAHSFFWHDYETFGRSPRHDRPAQFAGIRTDAELNEVGEPVNLHCQPLSDTLPDPEACLLTGILPQDCARLGVPEPAFAAAIERALGHAGTVGVGYNTLRFDDEVTRHLFWRNLIDPYAREWQNQCGRWDLLDLVRATHALRPEGIQWPTGDDGKTSFKLERLTQANGLQHEAAHDALSDVRATVALARLIRQHHPRLFDFAFKLHKKEAVWAEIGNEARPLLHVSGRYGVDRGCIAMVWPLGLHPRNKNELIVWDLSADPAELFDLRPEAIRARLFVRQEDLPEGSTRLPIKTIHVNKSPFVVSSLATLRDAQAERWGIDRARALRHAECLRDRGRQLDGLWSDVFLPHESADDDPESNLYGGFVGDADRRLLNQVRQLDAATLAERVHAGRMGFDDPRLDTLLWRYRARHHPEHLSDAERAQWDLERAERLNRGGTGRLSLAQYLDRIDALQAEREDDERAQGLLSDLVDWAEAIAP
ncbi:exodeoxyribonuclease I [Inhella crocodyli]|uniref:Exodeoxyribonuclease I n=1 Tax=Inhella crocodyli TaxID=2499851 RepID=A0A437LRG9_9BURK|nr:exodeoxyribonuclease I [Inhella crocodyli]RVT88007.1 exodeoxyribonuclease I [Inhella crocodyli]